MVNVLIADGDQVFSSQWQEEIQSGVRDTGNAFSPSDVDAFGARIAFSVLLRYRREVASRTREVLNDLSFDALARKPAVTQLSRLRDEGVVTPSADSAWLLDFWGKKTVAGLLKMPLTRHQVVHLNDCLALRRQYRRTVRRT